jgi:hypothetical protein
LQRLRQYQKIKNHIWYQNKFISNKKTGTLSMKNSRILRAFCKNHSSNWYFFMNLILVFRVTIALGNPRMVWIRCGFWKTLLSTYHQSPSLCHIKNGRRSYKYLDYINWNSLTYLLPEHKIVFQFVTSVP